MSGSRKKRVSDAVAHDQALAIVGQPPALRGIGEAIKRSERVSVVDQGGVLLPCQLNDAFIDEGDAFGEEVGGHIFLLQNDAILQIHAAQR